MNTQAGKPTSFIERHPQLGKSLFVLAPKLTWLVSADLDDRKAQAQKIISQYPNKIPVICEPADGSELTLDRTK